MKKLNRMLLIHWYSYSRELIAFGDINFLTGKTASGKSTVIDALQLVLLGDTSGSFFNKAANEKSVRTLKGYLYGENGDDGETGFRYLREGPFTSYVVLEFLDTEKQTAFLAGFAADCYADQNFTYKWFTADRRTLPESLFTDAKTQTPWTIAQLRSWLKTFAKKNYEIIDTNKRFQEVMLAKYGAVKRKYLTLLRKAVPFTPITNIEQFITESVCDVKNNIRIEQMQSDIRQYKNLEDDALRTQKRIEALSAIDRLTGIYAAEKERYRLQGYILLRAEQEEHRQEEKRVLQAAEERRARIREAEEMLGSLEAELTGLKQELEKLEEEYHTSDLVRRQKALSAAIEEAEKKTAALEAGIRLACEKVRSYGENWAAQLAKVSRCGIPVSEEERALCAEMRSLDPEETETFAFLPASEKMREMQARLAAEAFALQQRAGQLKTAAEELEGRVANLEKGIKPYPSQVLLLKNRLEKELFAKHRKVVEIPVFADLLEIRDPSWRDAIEGYLDRQKFNLLVPEAYYTDANVIYSRIRKEERIYDAGLVDIGRMRREFTRKAEPGSLAEEIETEDPSARLYADFLLGSVIKCEDVRELNRHRIAITRNVMLYKGYVSRRLNPARYADPFIGRRSMQILLERCREELAGLRREAEEIGNRHRIVWQASRCAAMSEFEAEQHTAAVDAGKALPGLRVELQELRKEYDGLDFTWLSKLEEKIRSCRKARDDREKEMQTQRDIRTRADEQLGQIEGKELPAVRGLIRDLQTRIEQEYDRVWITESAEPRFRKEQQQDSRVQLTLRESFARARTQTATQMENHLKDRRRLRGEYNQEYHMPYDIEREDNDEYDRELHNLADIRLPQYLDQIRDAREKAYNQFRDDFIARLKSNIESVREQIAELNNSLKNSVFGTDSYHFEMGPRAEYRSYYDMIMDPMLMDTGGWNIASENFNQKYQREIDSLFRALIINEADVTAERRAEYERNIRRFTDYKTYLVFDLIVTNEQGERQRLSRTLLKKSGGETQIPFYIALLASFSQVCRIRSRGHNNTVRVIILDEAFSKMDGERIRESIALLRRFGLQAIFSAPPEKIPDIAPLVDRNIAVYRSGHHSFTRYFDPAEVEDSAEVEDPADTANV